MNRKTKGIPPEGIVSIARGGAVVAGVFCLIVCVLMVTTYIRLRASHPLESTLIQSYVDRLTDAPENESLKKEIRSLDLLARRAFFTGLWQIRVGSYLILGSVAVMLICLKLAAAYGKKPPAPVAAGPSPDESISSTKAFKVILAGAAAIMAAALLISFLAKSTLENQVELTASSGQESAEGEAGTGTRWAEKGDYVENILATESLVTNWPFFRGPGGNGRAAPGAYPLSWDGNTGEGVLWKTEVPLAGFNSPILWEDRVFLSGSEGGTQEVYCFASSTGALLWRRSVENIPGSPAQPPAVSPDTGYAAPSMATDGSRVYAIFPTGDLACFDFEGTRKWAQNLGLPDNHYGHASSLMVYDDLLLVQYDDMSEPKLLALDAETGRVVWKVLREVAASWASPILIYTGRRPELIVNATPFVTSYDPRDGRELWRVECLWGEVGASPAYSSGMVFAANQYAMLAAISLDTKDILWEAYDDLPDASSPLATEEHLFIGTSYGVVTCFDAKTGQILWIHEFEEGFYSSPILAGDRVYLMDRSGIMHVFEDAPEYRPLGESPLGEPSDSTPAFGRNHIFIRGEKHLFCMGG
jgi:outer membrane protein assembly factor BamB